MKSVAFLMLVLFSQIGFANNKVVQCQIEIDGTQGELNYPSNISPYPTWNLGTVGGLDFEATSDNHYDQITLRIKDFMTGDTFETQSSLGQSEEGVVMHIPHNGKIYGVRCVETNARPAIF